MAFVYLRNQSGTPDQAMFNLKDQLVTNGGWTVESSSDGTTYNASGDEWGTDADVNANAWIRLSKNSREFIIQRNANAEQWEGKYSKSALFTGGAPDATTPPTATDEEYLGGASGGQSGFVNWFTAGSNVYHVIVNDSGTDNGFILVAYPSGTNPTTFFGIDPMVAGTAEDDPDPLCWIWSYIAGGTAMQDPQPNNANLALNTTGHWRGFYAAGEAGEAWEPWRAYEFSDSSSGTGAPVNIGDNPFNGKKISIPVMIARDFGDGGNSTMKGWSSLFQWAAGASSSKDIFDDGSGSGSHVQFGHMILPWGGGVAPLS